MRSFVMSGEADEMREFYCFGESIDLTISRRRATHLASGAACLAVARPSIVDARAGEDGPAP